jgi:acetyl esterase/lipase
VIQRYGEHPDQYCEVLGTAGPTAVLLHGGFWRSQYRCDLMHPMAGDLSDRGWPTWNIEYRRVGVGGGYPATLEDVAAACRLAGEHGYGPLIAIGHSAGGHLALWLASEGLVSAAMSLGGVCCLAEASRENLGDGAADDFVGAGPDEAPEEYARADPLQRLPTGVPTVLVHGSRDDVVPISQARRYQEAALAVGDACELHAFDGGHMAVIEPGSGVWPAIIERLEGLRSNGR